MGNGWYTALVKRQLVLWLCLIAIITGIFSLVYFAQKDRWVQRLWESRPTLPVSTPGYYEVTHVYDGDTILINMDGALEKVRFIGVDTPETHDPDVGVQCFGPESSSYTKAKLLNKKVRLESDSTNSNRDRYDRLLRYVFTEDDTLINNELIKEGYGFAYTRFPFIKLTDFVTSETLARQADKGLWQACQPFVKDGVYQTNELIQ